MQSLPEIHSHSRPRHTVQGLIENEFTLKTHKKMILCGAVSNILYWKLQSEKGVELVRNDYTYETKVLCDHIL